MGVGRIGRSGGWLGVVACVVVLGLASPSRAQQSPEQTVENLNREAMDAYNALDINKAGGLLEEALRVAGAGGVSPQLVARTNQNLGVVYIGGLSDQNGGFNYFVAAVCSDPNIQLDPLLSTPDIQSVWNAALQRARSGGCPTGGGAPPAPVPTAPQPLAPQPMGAPMMGQPMMPPQPLGPPPPPPPDQAIAHHSPPEQLSQTPLPLYVEINPLAHAKVIYVYTRGLGAKEFKRSPMYQYQSGFAYQISCEDVWEPKVSYYIEAQDDSGRVVGVAGSAAQPIEVPVVAARTQQGEPALPGASPPTSCATRECPPGVQGCKQKGRAPIGDKCGGNSDCQSGLECVDDACVIIGAGGTEVPDTAMTDYGTYEPVKPAEFKKTFVQLGFGAGLAFVQAGMPADRNPPANRIFIDRATHDYVKDPVAAVAAGQEIIFPEPSSAPERLNAWVPDADSADSAGALGGNCAADGKKTGPTLPQLLPSKYCVRVKKPGFVPSPMLRFSVGHFVLPRLAIAALVRFQFTAGKGPLAGLLLGARAEYLLTQPKAKGLMVSAFAGATAGEIQARPPATGTSSGAPFVKSGLGGVHVGAAVRYRIMEHFGVFAAPEVDAQLPTFLLNVDFTLAGVEGAF